MQKSKRKNSDLPTILDDSIKIIVESSEKTVVEKTKIDSVNSYSGGRFSLFVENPGAPLWYQEGTTKVIKDGEEIPFSELKEGDIIRISYIHDDGSDETDEDGNKLAGFTDYISVIVVLSETESLVEVLFIIRTNKGRKEATQRFWLRSLFHNLIFKFF